MNKCNLNREERTFRPYAMGLDGVYVLHDRGLVQTHIQATKHISSSEFCIWWVLHGHTQVTNQAGVLAALHRAGMWR